MASHDPVDPASDDPPYILDVAGLGPEPRVPEQPSTQRRRWIGVHFVCCDVYTRIYRNRGGTAYEGYCPRCARPVRVGIGPGGTHHRMFRAT